MNYGTDINIFANGLPDFISSSLPAGSQRLSSKPALDLTLTEISDERLVLLLDLYKMLFTPPEYLFWSRDSQNQPNPITTNIPDLLGDTYDRATLARLGAELETLILLDARYAAAQVLLTTPEGAGVGPVTISATVLPTGADSPIELVVSVTGSSVTLVRATA